MKIRSVRGPILTALESRVKRQQTSFHFPGHKNGRAVHERFRRLIGDEALRVDLTELEGLDNLNLPNGVIAESQEMAAEIFGADRSFYLINGTTVGIHAAILATCAPDSVCIMAKIPINPRKLRRIVVGCIPKYLMPEFNPEYGVFFGIKPTQVEEMILKVKAEGRPIGCVFVLSSTYFGMVSDLREVSEICQRYEVPLIVDDAHGGHFRFHEQFPLDALASGADIVIQSTHKVLTSLTQCSMLHVKSSLVSTEKIFNTIRALQSTSPSYLLLASLEAAVLHVSDPYVFDEPLHAARIATKGLQQINGMKILSQIKELQTKSMFDPLRVCIFVDRWDISPNEIGTLLDEEFNLVVETIIGNILVLAFGPGSHISDAHKLVAAMRELSSRYFNHVKTDQKSVCPPEIPPMKMKPSELLHAVKKVVPLEKSLGEICAEAVAPYPPGIPIVNKGELITPSVIRAIKFPEQFKTITIVDKEASPNEHTGSTLYDSMSLF